MHTVTWVSMATDESMGLQRYEHAIQAAIRELAPTDLRVTGIRVRSLRSTGHPDARRTLMGAAGRWPAGAARALGAVTYGRRELVHRFDLRLPAAAGAEVLTVHDLPALHYPDEVPVPRSAAASMRRAAALVCPSRFTAEELCARYDLDPARLHVIPNGVSPEFGRARPSLELMAELGVRGRYVLHAAGATQRKNLPALAQAWRRCADLGATLVLAGPEDERRCRAFAGVPQVVFAGYRPPAAVAALMVGAAAVVVPSTYEGFGLPALEAMAAGTPVVAADAAALPEVCGGAALVVEPAPAALAGALRQILEQPELSAQLAAAGRRRAAAFTWPAAAAAHLEVYRSVLVHRGHGGPP